MGLACHIVYWIFEEAERKWGRTSVNVVGNKCKTSAHQERAIEGQKKPAISIALLVHCLHDLGMHGGFICIIFRLSVTKIQTRKKDLWKYNSQHLKTWPPYTCNFFSPPVAVQISIRVSVTKISLDNNSYLVKCVSIDVMYAVQPHEVLCSLRLMLLAGRFCPSVCSSVHAKY